jgi:hypothetical protein
MKLSMIAPATETITVAGQEVRLRGASLIDLEPIISVDGAKFTQFIAAPALQPQLCLPFFLVCFAGDDSKEEAEVFFKSLPAGRQLQIISKCINLSLPPLESEEAQPIASSPSSGAPPAAEEENRGTWTKTSLNPSTLS